MVESANDNWRDHTACAIEGLVCGLQEFSHAEVDKTWFPKQPVHSAH